VSSLLLGMGGASAARNPSAITGLRQWLRSDAGVTRTSNVAGQFTAANLEYLSAADNALFPNSGDWTFGIWVRADSFTAGIGNFIAGQWDAGANQLSWTLLYNDFTFNGNPKRFAFWTSVDGTNGAVFNATGAGQTALNTWYYVIVKNAAATRTKKIKVNNGAEETTTYPSGSLFNSSARFCIGCQLNGNAPAQNWDGPIRLAGWWSRLTTDAEDTWLYNGGAGRAYSELGQAGGGSNLLTNNVAYWLLGEKSGTRADSSPNALNLTDNNTVTLAAGPVSGVDNSTNSYVTSWADQSGNGYTMAAPAVGNASLYLASQLNGYPGIQLDGLTSELRVASMLGLTNGQARTVLVVYKVPSASDPSTIFIQGQSGSGTNPWSLDANTQSTAGTKFGFRAGAGATFDTNATCDTSFHSHYVAMSTMVAGQPIISNTLYRLDKVTKTLTLVGGSNQFATMAAANFTGLGFFPAATDAPRACTVVEEVVYDHALSAGDRLALESYITTRYGL
jgi:hypothetical protein